MAKAWWKGKKVNPEFTDAAHAHRRECIYCDPVTYESEQAHQNWRSDAEEHMGKSLPPTFLTEAPRANRNVSKIQGNWKLDLEAKKYD